MERWACVINSFFIEGEGDFICPSTASSSQFAILSAECIRNVTRG